MTSRWAYMCDECGEELVETAYYPADNEQPSERYYKCEKCGEEYEVIG